MLSFNQKPKEDSVFRTIEEVLEAYREALRGYGMDTKPFQRIWLRYIPGQVVGSVLCEDRIKLDGMAEVLGLTEEEQLTIAIECGIDAALWSAMRQ